MIVGLLAGYRSVLVLSAILSIFGTGLGLVPYLAAWRIAVAIQGAGSTPENLCTGRCSRCVR